VPNTSLQGHCNHGYIGPASSNPPETSLSAETPEVEGDPRCLLEDPSGLLECGFEYCTPPQEAEDSVPTPDTPSLRLTAEDEGGEVGGEEDKGEEEASTLGAAGEDDG